MKPKRDSMPFSLPVLLSFNELAWVVIFGMGIICVAAFNGQQADQHNLESSSNEVVKANASIRELADATSNLKEKLAVAKLAKSNLEQLLLAAGESNRETKDLNFQLSADLAGAKKELIQSQEREKDLAKKLTDTEQKQGELDDQLAKAKADLDRMLLGKDASRLKNLLGENQRLRDENAKLNELGKTLNGTGQKGINKQLLGLAGGITNVAILLDRSGSMNDDNRWKETLAFVEIWLQHLPVKRCVWITFSTHADAHPPSGLLTMEGGEGDINRAEMIATLRELPPEGTTNTKEALQKAYEYSGTNKIDTIILFTDGAPTTDEMLFYSEKEAGLVFKLVSLHPDIPINVVALGKYYKDPRFIGFLVKLQHKTGGALFGK